MEKETAEVASKEAALERLMQSRDQIKRESEILTRKYKGEQREHEYLSR